MGFILGILIAIVVIYRLVSILKIMGTQDFLLGLSEVIAVFSAGILLFSNNKVDDFSFYLSRFFSFSFFIPLAGFLCLLICRKRSDMHVPGIVQVAILGITCYAGFSFIFKILDGGHGNTITLTVLLVTAIGAIYYIKKNNVLSQRRINITGGWAIAAGVFMSLVIILMAIIFNQGIGIPLFIVGIVLMQKHKPFRVPWVVGINVLLLGLLIWRADHRLGGADGLAVNTGSFDSGSDVGSGFSDVSSLAPDPSNMMVGDIPSTGIDNTPVINDVFDNTIGTADVSSQYLGGNDVGSLPSFQEFVINGGDNNTFGASSMNINTDNSLMGNNIVQDQQGITSMHINQTSATDYVMQDDMGQQMGNAHIDPTTDTMTFHDNSQMMTEKITAGGTIQGQDGLTDGVIKPDTNGGIVQYDTMGNVVKRITSDGVIQDAVGSTLGHVK